MGTDVRCICAGYPMIMLSTPRFRSRASGAPRGQALGIAKLRVDLEGHLLGLATDCRDGASERARVPRARGAAAKVERAERAPIQLDLADRPLARNGLRHAPRRLPRALWTLGLAENRLRSASYLEHLAELEVLDVADNEIASTRADGAPTSSQPSEEPELAGPYLGDEGCAVARPSRSVSPTRAAILIACVLGWRRSRRSPSASAERAT